MEFVLLNEEEFRGFWNKSPFKTFLQSPEVAKLREMSGWKIHYVGVLVNHELVAATMMVSKLRHFGQYEFYAPRGMLLDYSDEEVLTFFIQSLKKYIKKCKGYKLRMDPYLVNVERDINGEEVKNGVSNKSVVRCLEKLGFRYNPCHEQVKWMFVLDIDGKSEEEIMKGMRPNTRNTIRKTLKLGITTRELSYDELSLFMDIMNKTGKRKQFEIRDLSYFQHMYKLLYDRGEVKYLITELHLPSYIERIHQEIETERVKLSNIGDAGYKVKEKEAINKIISSLEHRISEAKEIMENTGCEKIVLSGSMFILIQPEIIYLSSGNYEEYLRFNSQYQIQWEMIQYGIKHNFKRYNFYGISGNFDKNDKDYGIYDFKKGFNGYVEELIGEYELPISKFYYRLFQFISKLRK